MSEDVVAVRVEWFAPERPVNGTVFVKPAKVCKEEGCGRPPRNKGGGPCEPHYRRATRGKRALDGPIAEYAPRGARPEVCSFEGCTKEARAGVWCSGHYQQEWGGRPLEALQPKRANGAPQARDEHGNKECCTCGLWLPVDKFERCPESKAADGLRGQCRPCRRFEFADRRYKVPGGSERMLERQGGQCPGCDDDIADSWVVHHDHDCCPGGRSCGKCVVCLLCTPCNVALCRPPRVLRRLADLHEGHQVLRAAS